MKNLIRKYQAGTLLKVLLLEEGRTALIRYINEDGKKIKKFVQCIKEVEDETAIK